MKELVNLTETAQGEVVGELTQKLPSVSNKTIVGKGKLEELNQLVLAREADIVIFNHELTARQASQIEAAVQVKVIDRVQLILDIFALRARSKEGQLQVELAQLNYLLPRLTGQGIAMSRLGGGIGTRGPGETKLETDRRHIRSKMTQIKHELKEIAAHRGRIRQKRQESEVFQIGLIGYTNAGKSTIMNLITEANTYSMNQLFATLDPLTKKWTLPSGMQMTLTDTVGFIQDLPTQLIEAFQSTLEESRGMDLLLHVVDASSTDRLQQEQTVLHLLKQLDMEEIPVLTVYNKADLCDQDSFVPTLFPSCLISALNPADADELKTAIIKEMKLVLVPYQAELSEDKAYLLNEMTLKTIVDHWEYQEETGTYLVNGYAKSGSKWLNEQFYQQ
ncbi:GTPase HflX [Vagococcus penaei]|nr:GTPase HflX [Vagococcus penaei]